MAEVDRLPLRTVLAATMAAFVGIGLARFAYSPLLPVLIARGWFAPGDAAYLGAANLLGYLGGAVAARRLGQWFGIRSVLRGAMLLAAVSLAACCMRMPFAWFFVWRLLSGIVGGALMILAPSSVMAQVPASRRGVASGVILTGVGLGIAASGTLVPVLLQWGLTQAWLGLAALALGLTLVAWRAWPDFPPPIAVTGTSPARFGLVCTAYGLCAVGMVPHMVFLVDFVARGLGRGLNAGSLIWVLFGAGALCGPIVSGRLADRFGAATAMRAVIATEMLCLLLLLVSSNPVAIGVSAAVAGSIVPGITAVMLGRVGAMAGSDGVARQRGWTLATVAWAIGQAAGAYGLAWVYGQTNDYELLFAAALAAMAAAAILETALVLKPRQRRIA
jgi:predicted MFS family arabinose efflux permease